MLHHLLLLVIDLAALLLPLRTSICAAGLDREGTCLEGVHAGQVQRFHKLGVFRASPDALHTYSVLKRNDSIASHFQLHIGLFCRIHGARLPGILGSRQSTHDTKLDSLR